MGIEERHKLSLSPESRQRQSYCYLLFCPAFFNLFDLTGKKDFWSVFCLLFILYSAVRALVRMPAISRDYYVIYNAWIKKSRTRQIKAGNRPSKETIHRYRST